MHKECIVSSFMNTCSKLKERKLQRTLFVLYLTFSCAACSYTHAQDTSTFKTVYISPQTFRTGPVSCEISPIQTEIIEKSLEVFLFKSLQKSMKYFDLFMLEMQVNDIPLPQDAMSSVRFRPHNEIRNLRVHNSPRETKESTASSLDDDLFEIETSGWAYFHGRPPPLNLLNIAVENAFKDNGQELLTIINEIELLQMDDRERCFSVNDTALPERQIKIVYKFGIAFGVIVIIRILYSYCDRYMSEDDFDTDYEEHQIEEIEDNAYDDIIRYLMGMLL